MKAHPICGLEAVAALFQRRPDDVQRLFYTEATRLDVGAWCALLAATKRPYRMMPPEELARAAGTLHHGGVAAIARARIPAILQSTDIPAALRQPDPILLLDGIGNPHNLGAIARSAAFFGARALILHEVPEQAMPSEAAYRTAEGGLEHLDLYRTRSLPAVIAALTPLYRIVAATLSPDAQPLTTLPRDRPVAVILGNEETGISPDVLAACRRQVRITGANRPTIQSLNVAQAAAVILHDITRKTDPPS
jgi:TrmH RNA methyltransferase